MLQAIDIALKLGQRELFSQFSLTVHPGQKVGLVGRNGVGKSTVFKLLLRQIQPDEGDILLPSSWRISYMAQHVDATERGALDYVIDGDQALRKVEQALAQLEDQQQNPDADPLKIADLHGQLADLDGYTAEARAGEILFGLGFTGTDFKKPFKDFSGGWRIRLTLARALMKPADLLLLDEPTNHLDFDTTLWLENWLQRFDGTLVTIAHDRAFLDNVTGHTVHILNGGATTYKGNYSSFERQRAEALLHNQAQISKQQTHIKHMEKFVARFRAKASKAKQAQSRLKALERMELVAPMQADSPYSFDFQAPEKISSPLISLRNVALGYGTGDVLRQVSQTILPGDRIGVLGVNGAGKSTLLKALVGELAPTAGEFVVGQNAQTGYFAQHQLETLNPDSSGLDEIMGASQNKEQWSRDYLGTWGFSGDMAKQSVHSYSGGEKARLVLALLALAKPAMLVLDEPTNHLDLDMREALAVALQDYPGALLVVSHDRAVLERCVDKLWLVADGTLQGYQGDIHSYAQEKGGSFSKNTVTQDTDASDHKKPNNKGQRQSSATKRQQLQPLRKEIKQLEKQQDKLSAKLKDIEATLADPEQYHSLPTKDLDELLKSSGALRQQLEVSETQWLEKSAELERLL